MPGPSSAAALEFGRTQHDRLTDLPRSVWNELYSDGITAAQLVALLEVAPPVAVANLLDLRDLDGHGRYRGGALDAEIVRLRERRAREERTKAARARLAEQGVHELAPGWRYMRPPPLPLAAQSHAECVAGEFGHYLDDLEVTLPGHEAAGCHAAVICDHGEAVYVCTKPAGHAPAASPATPGGSDTAGQPAGVAGVRPSPAENHVELFKQAAAGRRAALVDAAVLDPARSPLAELVKLRADAAPGTAASLDLLLWWHIETALSWDVAQLACELLGVPTVGLGKYDVGGYYDAVRRAAAPSPADLCRTAVAVLVAHAEVKLRCRPNDWRWIGANGARYFAWLTQHTGHEPGPSEEELLAPLRDQLDQLSRQAEGATDGGA